MIVYKSPNKPKINDSEKYVGCDTCKYTSNNKSCSYESAINRCLYGKGGYGKGIVLMYHYLPKYDDSYVYALWEPNWNDDKLPEELFEI